MKTILARVALAAVLAFGLAGCIEPLQKVGSFIQTASSATVPQKTAIIARSAFNTAQAGATNYLNLPRCNGANGPFCRDPAYTDRIGDAVLKGRDARKKITAYMKANPGKDIPVGTYNALITATAIIDDLTASYRAAAGK